MILLNNFNDLELFINLLIKNKQTYDILYVQRPWLDSFDNDTNFISTKIAILSGFDSTYIALKTPKDDIDDINTFLSINNATQLNDINISGNGFLKLNF